MDFRPGDVRDMFRIYGQIEKVMMLTNRQGRFTGTARIIFDRRSERDEAVEKGDGRMCEGRPVHVTEDNYDPRGDVMRDMGYGIMQPPHIHRERTIIGDPIYDPTFFGRPFDPRFMGLPMAAPLGNPYGYEAQMLAGMAQPLAAAPLPVIQYPMAFNQFPAFAPEPTPVPTAALQPAETNEKPREKPAEPVRAGSSSRGGAELDYYRRLLRYFESDVQRALSGTSKERRVDVDSMGVPHIVASKK